MARDPRTPDCAVKGCTRAAYRLGLCRAHARLVPRELGVRCAVACLEAQMTVKRRFHNEAAFIANRDVREARRTSAAA